MTTAAHVLLPREVVEKLRRLAQEELGEALSERERERWSPIVAALDQALNAEEPFERISERVVWVNDTDGEPTIRLEKLLNVGIVLERPDGESLSLSPGHNPTAVALALIALAAAGEGRG